MDGNNREQIIQMKKKGKAFANQIRTSNLSQSESWHALKTTIMKTMEYPMEAIHLKKHEWDNIMKPILQCALPKSGIVRTFPRTMLYSPLSYSGLGIMHPYYLQHIKHLRVCMEQTVNSNITHNLLDNFDLILASTPPLATGISRNPHTTLHPVG